MRQAGFGDVRVLRGGMVRWNDEGRPVVARKEAEAAAGHG
jgi:3-mercaptopyruvate sulfurtransferase SseA